MRASPPRLPSLASPVFIAALALLVINDFLLKPMFHDWATGKLSDFTGLFALAIFCATFWPRGRLFIGIVITAAFAFWKSDASQPLIDWLNGFAPVPIARAVDYTDLAAVPAVWLGVCAAHRVRPWPLPRVAQLALALFAVIAFTATPAPRPYSVRSTVEIVQPNDEAAEDETSVQAIFDELAAKHDLRCQVCDPLGDGRVYTGASAQMLIANFDDQTRTVFFKIVGRSNERAARKDVDRLSKDIRAALGKRFPDLKLMGYVTGREPYGDPRRSTVTLTVHLDAETLDVATAESAQRTLSQIVEDTVREHGLRIDKDLPVYYAGKRMGSTADDRELVLRTYNSHVSLEIIVACLSDAYEPLQRSLAATLRQRLDTAFGAERVTVAQN